MSKTLMVIVASTAMSSPALAQAPMTVREFNEIEASTPRNPLALLRPSARRAWDVMDSSIGAARAEEARARASGIAPPFCIPGQTNISPRDFAQRMQTVPPAQQGQSVNRVVRAWLIERFPC